jgi:hypothetical protein
MRIIARMNVGGPAVQVSGLMRGFDAQVFDQELVTGYCAADEADYLEKVATDVKAIRIDGLGRSIKPRADLTALFAIIEEIRRFKPEVINSQWSQIYSSSYVSWSLVKRLLRCRENKISYFS